MRKQSKLPMDEIEEAVKQYKDTLFRIAVAMTGRPTDAEDIVQDVFIRRYEKQPQFDAPEKERAWLIRVTVNLCKDRLRSHWWSKTVPLLDTYPAENEKQQSVMEAVLALPPKYRLVIHLFYYEGYATKEIAQLTQQEQSTVRQQLTRARRILKDFLETEGAPDEKLC